MTTTSYCERELAELRTAIADAAAVMSSIYESFRDGEKIDPAAVDIGIGCWLEKHAPDLLATRVEAKRLDEAQEEIAALREACTLALGIMEQKNRVTVLTTAKFVDVKFAPEDIAVLRAALEKKP